MAMPAHFVRSVIGCQVRGRFLPVVGERGEDDGTAEPVSWSPGRRLIVPSKK